MTKIWGYTPTAVLSTQKLLSGEFTEIKQVFSALLFREGVKGVCIKIEEVAESTQICVQLQVDENIVLTSHFSAKETGEYDFTMEEIVIPKVKIEVLLTLESGDLVIPISAIGNGMGFQKIKGEFSPTNHFGLGLIIP